MSDLVSEHTQEAKRLAAELSNVLCALSGYGCKVELNTLLEERVGSHPTHHIEIRVYRELE